MSPPAPSPCSNLSSCHLQHLLHALNYLTVISSTDALVYVTVIASISGTLSLLYFFHCHLCTALSMLYFLLQSSQAYVVMYITAAIIPSLVLQFIFLSSQAFYLNSCWSKFFPTTLSSPCPVFSYPAYCLQEHYNPSFCFSVNSNHCSHGLVSLAVICYQLQRHVHVMHNIHILIFLLPLIAFSTLRSFSFFLLQDPLCSSYPCVGFSFCLQ